VIRGRPFFCQSVFKTARTENGSVPDGEYIDRGVSGDPGASLFLSVRFQNGENRNGSDLVGAWRNLLGASPEIPGVAPFLSVRFLNV
jgi:hypothetical protein